MSDAEMSTTEIKEFIFDELVAFLEETGESGAVTAEEIAEELAQPLERIVASLAEMMGENVIARLEDEGETYYHFTEEFLDELLDEMEESGWEPPDNDYQDDDEE